MKISKKHLLIIIISYLFSALIGTLAHFIYKWSNQLIILKPFVPIDESIFEHLKLLFYPLLITSLLEALITKQNIIQILSIRGLSSIASIVLLVIFFYTYTSITKEPILLIDIISYYVLLLFAYLISIPLMHFKTRTTFIAFSIIAIIISISLFSFFTEYKPSISFFQE